MSHERCDWRHMNSKLLGFFVISMANRHGKRQIVWGVQPFLFNKSSTSVVSLNIFWTFWAFWSCSSRRTSHLKSYYRLEKESANKNRSQLHLKQLHKHPRESIACPPRAPGLLWPCHSRKASLLSGQHLWSFFSGKLTWPWTNCLVNSIKMVEFFHGYVSLQQCSHST